MKPLPKSLQDNPQLGAWLGLEQDGRVTLHSGKVELGQGIHTALIQIAAEELNLAPDCFDLEAVSTSNGPDEWLTASSQSIESGGTAIRAAAACLRDAVIGIAASMLNADPAHLHLAQGRVLHGDITTGHSLWSLADRIDWEQDLRAGWTAKAQDVFQWVGKPVPRRDLPAILSGGSFLQDMQLPGMLHGRVLHPPIHGAVLEDVPAAAFQGRFGEQCRLLRQQDFLAIVAESETLARQAGDYLGARLRWRQPEVSIPEEVAPWLQGQPGQVMRDDPVPVEIGAAQHTATYSRGFLLHGSIASSCAVAWRNGGKLHIWTHSQGIFPLRSQLVRALGLPAAEIVLEHRPSAGCYGHNGADDVALEAALLAEAFPGRPVRVLWSRADEMTATCGSAMAISLAAGLDASGKIGAWQAEVWSGTHSSRPGAGGDINLTAAAACDPAFAPKAISDVADAVGGGAMRNVTPIYDLPSFSVRHHLLTSLPLRTSSLRALGAQPNVFAIEGFMDELAELAGCDPLEFRRWHLSDPRAIAVLDRVAAMAGWKTGTETGTGRAKGIGFARYKNKSAYCAVVVEVEVEEIVRVTRVWCAVDAGFVINPDGARNQVEGGIVQSLSWCLKEAVRSADGMVSSRDWDSYPILRFSEVPEIETSFIVDREAEALGVGETSQGPTAAALGNAVSRALGIRLRDMPFTRERLLAALA
ncbi:molybdopterin cofactor-binding domain-containing protein [Ferrovibrio sp.]|uniref:xanthine dehydrogenase family protein molybdopterin-binding subunit n=1 Tax=Ferrovibrio sp. TaxID=1917215 RepID=UPI003D137784